MGTSFSHCLGERLECGPLPRYQGIFFIAGVSLLLIARVLFDCCDKGLNQ